MDDFAICLLYGLNRSISKV